MYSCVWVPLGRLGTFFGYGPRRALQLERGRIDQDGGGRVLVTQHPLVSAAVRTETSCELTSRSGADPVVYTAAPSQWRLGGAGYPPRDASRDGALCFQEPRGCAGARGSEEERNLRPLNCRDLGVAHPFLSGSTGKNRRSDPAEMLRDSDISKATWMRAGNVGLGHGHGIWKTMLLMGLPVTMPRGRASVSRPSCPLPSRGRGNWVLFS